MPSVPDRPYASKAMRGRPVLAYRATFRPPWRSPSGSLTMIYSLFFRYAYFLKSVKSAEELLRNKLFKTINEGKIWIVPV
jgi:hypothetical protein